MPSAPALGPGSALELSDDVWTQPFNGPLVHEVVVAELAARRQGTHATKNRAMVSGGGAKPYRQKGTGRARQGSTRAPQWAGGGVVFGPSPRSYTVKVNRKVFRAALRAALSVHAERSSVRTLDPAAFSAPSTKQAAGLLADRGRGKVLLVLGEGEEAAAKSFRNLTGVNVLPAVGVGVADIVGAATLIVSASANEVLESRARKPEKRVLEPAAATTDSTEEA